MQKNMGSIDRSLRIAAAVVLAVIGLTGAAGTVWSIVLGAAAVMFLATSFIGVCPLYIPLHLSTLKKKQ